MGQSKLLIKDRLTRPMNKTVASLLGMFIFAYAVLIVIGIGNGYMEQQAFVQARSEIIQRVKEADPTYIQPYGAGTQRDYVRDNMDGFQSASLTNYITQFKTTFADAHAEVRFAEGGDRNGNGYVDFGDVVVVDIEAKGSGFMLFNRSESEQTRLGKTDGRMHLRSSREVQIQNRPKESERP